MKKLLMLLLALAMLLSGASALATEDTDHSHLDDDGMLIANPMHDVATFEALVQAVPGITLAPIPEDASSISYCWIHTEPVIAQVQFYWGEDYYTYRAAALTDPANPADIDGVYLPFDLIETFDNLFENDQDAFVLKSSSEDEYVVADWARNDLNTQYSLFSETAGEPDMRIIDLVELLLPAGDDWALSDDE